MKYLIALKKTGLLFLGLLYCLQIKAQIFVNVEASGSNNGSSWQNAYPHLQQAINAANEGDQIWVATGTYFPGKPGNPRTTTFHVQKGIQLYGGFAGTETKRSERNPSKFPTVLSGDLNQDDIVDDFETNRRDNVWTVMLVENRTPTLPVIDGITFESGHADGDSPLYEDSNGGGLFLYGPAIVRNCSFSQNYSIKRAGALFLVDSIEGGHAQWRENQFDLEVEACQFENNFSRYGGAINLRLIKGKLSKIKIHKSDFMNNKAEMFGGGLFVFAFSEKTTVQIDSCNFSHNFSSNSGGSINFQFHGDSTSIKVQNSTFSENNCKAFGGAVSIRSFLSSKGNTLTIDRCRFENNVADAGGAVSFSANGRDDSFLIQGSTFIENKAKDLNPTFSTSGGAIMLGYFLQSKQTHVKIKSSSFQNNSSAGIGGGAIGIIPGSKSNFTKIHDCSFSDNQTNGEGTPIHYHGSRNNYELKDNTFHVRNSTDGLALFSKKPSVDSSMFFLFFQGALWLQIFYSLLLFLTTRERTILYFAFLMAGISALYLLLNDVFIFAFGSDFIANPKLHFGLVRMTIVLTIISFIKFAQHYLNIDQYYPSLKKVVFYFILILLSADILNYTLFAGLWQSDNSIWKIIVSSGPNILTLIGLVLPFIGAIVTIRKGYKPALFLLPVLLFVGIAGLYLQSTYVIGASTNNTNILISQGFMLLAIMVIAIANGNRTNLLKKDKDRAKRLAELDAAKTRLYTNITHEFRTPLTVIMGASDLVKGNEPEKDLIKRNGKQLLQLINQMLDLSKLEGGALKLQPQQGNIIPFTEYLVESFQSMADSKHVRLTFYRELDELNMDYDAEKMQQIISNLLSNAIKFTGTSGKVIVHAKEEKFDGKPYLTLAVRDNGEGIPEENIPHVFDRFFQVDDSDMRHSEGSGIGLALVKELVELMKGQIEVTSKVGEGTVFTVRIPISRVAPVQGEGIDTDKLVLPTHSTTKKEATPPVQPLADDLPLALIIEDNKDIVSFLRTCLHHQYKIEVAFNGREGIDKALDIVPDIIISDVMMPEADGYTVCKTLKADERTSHVPIILLTAKATQEDKVHGLNVGADAYLSKPFHQEELEIRLQKLIELRQQLQSRYQRAPKGEHPTANKEDAFIQKLRSIIEEKMADEAFSIHELCRTVGLSRMQVHRKLKALTGLPATAFINSVRLQKGYELLMESDYNVSEVAYKVGFPDPSYFTRLFVKQYGQPPSEINRKG